MSLLCVSVSPRFASASVRSASASLRPVSDAGFTLVELMIASTITLVVMGVAFATFRDAQGLGDTVMQMTDSSQNLRVGTNLLVRDLMQAGRNIPIGGIAIPSGGATAIHRPGPPNTAYTFDNATATTLSAITTGDGLGPTVDGRSTDLITIVMADPFLDELNVFPSDAPAGAVKVALDGSSVDVGSNTAWLEGDPANGVPPITPGDLIYFLNGGTALQTVTRVEGSVMFFEPNDPFNLNQRNATAGSMTQILPTAPSDNPCNSVCGPAMSIRRVVMYTYYVAEETAGVPRLMRVLNHFPASALAGVIEDLTFSFDLVDGVYNPVGVTSLPYTTHSVTYAASQIRKVGLHVGVRSETVSARSHDYLRSHLSTVISIRNLAYVERYDTQ